MQGAGGFGQEVLQDVLGALLAARMRNHQLRGCRQTESHSPRFSSFHFESAQSRFRIAADAVGSEGGTGVVSEEHAATTTVSARIPNFNKASRSNPSRDIGPTVDAVSGCTRILGQLARNCKPPAPPGGAVQRL